MSKRRGLPEQARMRHDSHFVEALSERFGASLGRWIPVEEIETNPNQPRTSVGDLTELTRSIESKGILEPLLVRPAREGRYTIIAGERRFRAAVEAGLTEVPCIELDVSVPEMMELALIENLHRKDLHPFEEAEGYAALTREPGYTQQKIADAVGKSRVSITEALSLLDIPEDLRHQCRRADIDARSVLLEIARLGDRERMEEAIARVSTGSTREDLRARKKQAGSENRKAKRFAFVYRPKGGPFKLNLSFAKARVDRSELIDTLRQVLKQLESGEIRLSKRG
ncbi:MAG TPA: ParB/RepB/Spo0J family partition protein [Thermoanaerobaculia bacterium]|nr:ParB/RepB/Spo0J family partition protein [Thermoanaerobaculia bacterium]